MYRIKSFTFNSNCPNCKKTKISVVWTGKSRTLSPEATKKKAAEKQYVKDAHKEKGKTFENIKNKEDLKAKLLSELYLPNGELNEYNAFILERLENPVIGKLMEKHHIIPLHAGGPEEEWNLMPLTPEDHIEAHAIRARVYQEAGDINAVKFRSKTSDLTGKYLKAKALGDETRRKQGTGIYAPGVSSKGGKIGGSTVSHKKDLQHSTKMHPLVYKALYEGCRWKHEKTSTEVIIEQNTVFTLPQLLDKLIDALPDGLDKKNLAKKKKTTVTSSMSHVIKGLRKTCYGWSFSME